MSVRLVIDMNLSVEWVSELAQNGWSAVHWSTIGDPRADDAVIMAWALAHGCVVFTHDLDFGTMLALTMQLAQACCKFAAKTFYQKTLGRC